MNWQEALKKLSDGNAVQRKESEHYIDARFGGGEYTDEHGSAFRLVQLDENDNEEAYTPSDEDKAATDWQLA